MKRKLFFSFLLLFSLLLSGCDAEREVDEKVLAYIHEKYGFDADITYRQSVNEGNMGERVYGLQRQDEPKVEFTVYLTGMMSTDVVGDNYEEQEEAYLLAQKFMKTYEQQLAKINFSDIQFEEDLEVKATLNAMLSIFDDASVEKVMQLIDMLHAFKQEEHIQKSWESLSFSYGNDGFMYLEDIEYITTVEQLKSVLIEDISLVNESLRTRDEALFLELEQQLKAIGFTYRYEFHRDVDHTVGCYESELIDSECIGGYWLALDTERIEKQALWKLVTLLNNHSSFTFKEVTIFSQKERVRFDDVQSIIDSSKMEDGLVNHK